MSVFRAHLPLTKLGLMFTLTLTFLGVLYLLGPRTDERRAGNHVTQKEKFQASGFPARGITSAPKS